METAVPVRKAERGAHKIQADALNDDIKVTAICDVHTSLKSRFPLHQPPLPTTLFLSCLSLFWLSWSQLPGKKWRNGHKESRERRASLFTSTLWYREGHAFSNICNRQLPAHSCIKHRNTRNQPLCRAYSNSWNLKGNDPRKGLILTPFKQRLRWSRGSVLAFGTQVRGFKPGRSRRIFQGEKTLPSEGK
jgi:hypothetical protein